jgi:hypothetical protein
MRAMRAVGAAIERTDKLLRPWPVTGCVLVGLAIALYVSTLIGRG